MDLRKELIEIALKWQERYGVAPAITTSVSEYDAAIMVGMKEEQYSIFMQDKTAVNRGHDFIFNDIKYQIKANRPSGKPGSKITNAGKAKNYEWDVLIWIRYDMNFNIEEDRKAYISAFDKQKRISPSDMRNGNKWVFRV